MTQNIELSKLQPHPDNPRLFLREDVINSIAAQIQETGIFDQAHALIVRPVNGFYQVIQGHHRIEAAKQAGLESVPCWVREMDDSEAFMQLALGNAQDALSPLEIGMHALKAVPLGDGGRGKSGGLSEYAKSIGKQAPHITIYRQAAEVYTSIKNHYIDVIVFVEKAQHLAAIHKADSVLWPTLVNEMLARQWSAKDTEAEVKKVNEVIDAIPDWWALDKENIALQTLDGKGKGIKAMLDLVSKTDSELYTVTLYFQQETDVTETRNGREYRKWESVPQEYDQRQAFRNKLTESDTTPDKQQVNEIRRSIIVHTQLFAKPSESWQPVLTDDEWRAERARQEQIAAIARRERYMPRLIQGDVMAGLRQLSSESVDLECIDPPYAIGKAEWDEFESVESYLKWAEGWLKECYRVLKPTGALYLFGRFTMLRHLSLIAEKIGFIFHKDIAWDTIQGSGGAGLWPFRHETILYFTKTDSYYEDAESVKLERHEEHIREYKGVEYNFKSPSTVWRFPCVDNQAQDRTEHPTQKPVEIIERIIKASSPTGGIVLDCFMGSGTTGVAAMKLARRCIGIERDDQYIEIAKGRFDETEIEENEQ